MPPKLKQRSNSNSIGGASGISNSNSCNSPLSTKKSKAIHAYYLGDSNNNNNNNNNNSAPASSSSLLLLPRQSIIDSRSNSPMKSREKVQSPLQLGNNMVITEPMSIASGDFSSSSSCIQKQFAKVASGFVSLSNSPSELWKAYLLKFLDSYAYFSFSLIFTLFLSDDFGMTDIQAGTVYGAWGALITVFGLFTGTVIDNLGVAKCLRIGFVLSFVTRVVIFACTSREVLLVCLLITLPFSNCLGIPVLTVGIRRYTTEENRGFAFGLFYVVMNVGALVVGPLVDALTLYYNGKHSKGSDGETLTQSATTTAASWVMTTNRAIILSGVVANFIAVFVAFTVREIKVDACSATSSFDEGTDSSTGLGLSDGDSISNKRSNVKSSNMSKFQPLKGSSYQILAETMRTPNFRRFLLVCLLTINVRMVFRHL
jgi:MFS family permease